MINARAETLTELPSFKPLLDRRRCIIPADGFYEWRKEGKRKVPMWVYLKTKQPFALAGLWDEWRKPDGKRLESFTIITTEPNELVRPIHNPDAGDPAPPRRRTMARRITHTVRQSQITV